jgi:hypothetical protein
MDALTRGGLFIGFKGLAERRRSCRESELDPDSYVEKFCQYPDEIHDVSDHHSLGFGSTKDKIKI